MDPRPTASPSRPVRGFLPTAPDLVFNRRAGEEPTIKVVAPWLAARLGKEPHELFGHPAATVEPVLPGLVALIDAAFAGATLVISGRSVAQAVPGAPPVASLLATPLDQAAAGGDVSVAVQAMDIGDTAGLRATHAFFGLIGHSPAMRAVFDRIERYAASPAPVLMTGESGTGKELAARALHQCGPRHNAPFVAVNCAALSSELIESELFGHEKGAFTGAVSSHRGRFERADGGTLFLDEIGDMPRESQTTLLRVLEEGAVERVGSERPISINVRVIAATNVPLEHRVAARRFREDLYYRLSVLRVHLPPLRERREDLMLLVAYFLSVFAHHYGRDLIRLTPGASHLLTSYPWPGNVRELKNVLERVVVESAGDVIGERAFIDWIRERNDLAPGAWDLSAAHRTRMAAPPLVTPYGRDRPTLPAPTIDASYTESDDRSPPTPLTREATLSALAASGGNVTKAARQLGVHKATLYRRLRAWGVGRKDFSPPSS